MNEVTLQSRWEELFGKTSKDIPDQAERRARWEQWKLLCVAAGAADLVKYWEDCREGCTGCRHRDNDWCKENGLPCTVNPILTFKHNIPGMACMGAGYEAMQTELFK